MERLLGSYPSVNLHDPEIYVADIASLLSSYPLWAGEMAIDRVKKTTKFIPTVADLHPELESAVKPLRYAQQWEQRAHAQIEDRTTPSGNFADPVPK